MFASLNASLNAFRDDERGAATVWMIFWTVILMMVGGVAVDASKAWRMKTMLQAAADSAAHAAAIAQAQGEDPVATAISYAHKHFPPDEMGEVLKQSDIMSGEWDENAHTVVAATNPYSEKDVVRVVLRRASSNDNAEPTTLLKLVGLLSWDISAEATARSFVGVERQCLRRGLIARNRVDLQSNNFFENICVGGSTVEVNNGNSWLTNVLVAVPTEGDIVTPGSDIDAQNPGLREALVYKKVRPRGVEKIAGIIQDYMAGFNDFNGNISQYGVVNIRSKSQIDFAAMTADPNRKSKVFVYECTGSGTVTVPGDFVIDGVKFMTNCSIKFSNNATVIDSVIGTTGTAAQGNNAVVSAPSGVTLGLDDNCTPGMGTQLLVVGDVKAAADFSMYGSQIIATQGVSISAKVQALDGVSIISGADIDVSSNNSFGSCDGSDFDVPGFDYAVVN